MSKAEAEKKLVRPGLASGFGYAMNDATSGKFKGDLKDPLTVLVYESKSTIKNAHGSPSGEKGLAVTVSGKVLSLRR
jgi:hypothetical protein